MTAADLLESIARTAEWCAANGLDVSNLSGTRHRGHLQVHVSIVVGTMPAVLHGQEPDEAEGVTLYRWRSADRMDWADSVHIRENPWAKVSEEAWLAAGGAAVAVDLVAL